MVDEEVVPLRLGVIHRQELVDQQVVNLRLEAMNRQAVVGLETNTH